MELRRALLAAGRPRFPPPQRAHVLEGVAQRVAWLGVGVGLGLGLGLSADLLGVDGVGVVLVDAE